MAAEAVRAWSVEQVCEWLQSTGLGDHVPAFRAAGIAGDRLLDLEMQDLKESNIGANITGRNEILVNIQRLATQGPDKTVMSRIAGGRTDASALPRTHSSSDPPPPRQRRWSFANAGAGGADASASPSSSAALSPGSTEHSESSTTPVQPWKPKRHSKSPSSPNIFKDILTPGEKPPVPAKPLPSPTAAVAAAAAAAAGAAAGERDAAEASSPSQKRPSPPEKRFEPSKRVEEVVPGSPSPTLGKKPSLDRVAKPPILPRKGSVDTILPKPAAPPALPPKGPAQTEPAAPPRLPAKSSAVMAMAAAHDHAPPLPPKPEGGGVPTLPPKPVSASASALAGESPPLPPKTAAVASAIRKAHDSPLPGTPPPLPPKTSVGAAPMSPTSGERFSFDSQMDQHPPPRLRPAAPLPGLPTSASMPSLSSIANETPAEGVAGAVDAAAVSNMYARPLKPKRSVERKASVPLTADDAHAYAAVQKNAQQAENAYDMISQRRESADDVLSPGPLSPMYATVIKPLPRPKVSDSGLSGVVSDDEPEATHGVVKRTGSLVPPLPPKKPAASMSGTLSPGVDEVLEGILEADMAAHEEEGAETKSQQELRLQRALRRSSKALSICMEKVKLDPRLNQLLQNIDPEYQSWSQIKQQRAARANKSEEPLYEPVRNISSESAPEDASVAVTQELDDVVRDPEINLKGKIRYEVAAQSHTNMLYAGFLTKQGGSGLRKNWRKRWFVVSRLTLYYYKTPTDAVALGKIPLPGYTINATPDKKFGFKVDRAGSRTYRFHTENQDEYNTWTAIIACCTTLDEPLPDEREHYRQLTLLNTQNALAEQAAPDSVTKVLNKLLASTDVAKPAADAALEATSVVPATVPMEARDPALGPPQSSLATVLERRLQRPHSGSNDSRDTVESIVADVEALIASIGSDFVPITVPEDPASDRNNPWAQPRGRTSSDSAPVPKAVVTLCPHTGEEEDELSFDKGQSLTAVAVVDADWYLCRMDDRVGLVPKCFVSDAA